MAAVTANGGQLTENLYVLGLSQGDPVLVTSENSVPQWLGWLSGDTILAVYENRAVLYNAAGGEKASYDFGGGTLASVSSVSSGVALLLRNGQTCTAVLTDKNLGVQYSGSVLAANSIVRTADAFYLLTDSTVECFNTSGEFQWNQAFSARPQALIPGKKLIVLTGNTAQVLTDGVLYVQPYAAVQYYTNAGSGRQGLTKQNAHNYKCLRGAYWDKRMMADKGDELNKSIAAFCGGKAGK